MLSEKFVTYCRKKFEKILHVDFRIYVVCAFLSDSWDTVKMHENTYQLFSITIRIFSFEGKNFVRIWEMEKDIFIIIKIYGMSDASWFINKFLLILLFCKIPSNTHCGFYKFIFFNFLYKTITFQLVQKIGKRKLFEVSLK